jgi:hypothetical protein
MYTGHFGVALAAAGGSRRIPLGLLIVAAFGADITEGLLAAANVNDPSRVWSHSLPSTVTIGVVLALGWRIAGGTWKEASMVCIVAASHTLLDYVTAVKTYWPGAAPSGLGLYHRPALDTVVEGIVCFAGWWIWRGGRIGTVVRPSLAWPVILMLVALQGVASAHLAILGPLGEWDAMSKFVR